MIIRREDFGDVSELTKGSSKKLWVTCDDCGVGLLRSNKVVKKRDIDL